MSDSMLFGLSSNKGRWLFIPFSILIFICMGTVYSWSVFKNPLELLFNINATQSGLPYMVFLICYAVGMAASGPIIEKYGPRIIIVIGGALVGTGWILSSYATNIYQMVITYGVIAGCGVGIGYGGPMAVIAKWFPKQKGLILGWILMGFGLSPFITAPLARWMIEKYGVMESFKFLGMGFLLIIPILGMGFRFPNNEDLSSKNSNHSDVKGLNIVPKEMIKEVKFYGLWFCFIIGAFIGLMIVGVTSPIGEEIIRLSPKSAASFVSIFAVFNALGRPLFGWLTDKIYPRYGAVLSFGMIIFASLLMLFAKENSIFIYFLSFSLFWMNLGGWLAIAPASTAIFFGDRYYSTNYGIVFTAYGVGAVLGNFLSGMVKSSFGSYQYIFYPIVFVAAFGIFLSLKMMKHRH